MPDTPGRKRITNEKSEAQTKSRQTGFSSIGQAGTRQPVSARVLQRNGTSWRGVSVCECVNGEIYYKETAHVIKEAEKLQGGQPESWRPRRAEGQLQSKSH